MFIVVGTNLDAWSHGVWTREAGSGNFPGNERDIVPNLRCARRIRTSGARLGDRKGGGWGTFDRVSGCERNSF